MTTDTETRNACVGPYRIDSLLGIGTSATVFDARHEMLQRNVALKLLRPNGGDRARWRDRFEREQTIAAGLDHPNIARLLHTGLDEDGEPYGAFELVPGPPLSTRLARGKLELNEAVRIAGELADAIAYLHRQGIVHRDIKADNVVLSLRERGRPKPYLIDFGTACRIDEPTELPYGYATPMVMSPEQIRASVHGRPHADPRSDIFAFGALLFRMVTGTSAFPRTGELRDRLRAVTRETPPELPSWVPSHLRNLIRHCLAKDPADRPASMDAVCDALAADPTDAEPAQAPAAPPRVPITPGAIYAGLATGAASALALLQAVL